jgi:hypothetical protein
VNTLLFEEWRGEHSAFNPRGQLHPYIGANVHPWIGANFSPRCETKTRPLDANDCQHFVGARYYFYAPLLLLLASNSLFFFATVVNLRRHNQSSASIRIEDSGSDRRSVIPSDYFIHCFTHLWLKSGLPDGIFSYQKCQFWYILEDLGIGTINLFNSHLVFYCKFAVYRDNCCGLFYQETLVELVHNALFCRQ